MGRRNCLFAWTELGAKHIGIVQSLLATCRLHDVNPYDYFVDVLRRVDQHPESLVHQLTPRLWKELDAASWMPPIRYARICMTHENASQVNNADWLPLSLDPHTKRLAFSDEVALPTALSLHQHFANRTMTGFGIETNLTDDTNIPALHIVMKLMSCNG